jgi:hypothetical protein
MHTKRGYASMTRRGQERSWFNLQPRSDTVYFVSGFKNGGENPHAWALVGKYYYNLDGLFFTLVSWAFPLKVVAIPIGRTRKTKRVHSASRFPSSR